MGAIRWIVKNTKTKTVRIIDTQDGESVVFDPLCETIKESMPLTQMPTANTKSAP